MLTSHATQLPEAGDVVLGKYRIVSVLGRGGMGVVFAAENIATEGPVALKWLRPSAHDRDGLARVAREARAVARLRGRFVARVLDLAHAEGGTPVLVMERLEGKDLGAIMRERATLPVEEAVSYVLQACAGVAEAHANGIVHRDLKPANLFIETTSCAAVRVLDFGVAKVGEPDVDLTSPSAMLGTLAYMSPEQLRSPEEVDARSDVWALGAVLFRLLSGRHPIEGRGVELAARTLSEAPVPRVERSDVPRELADVVATALDKSMVRRFPDARSFGLALRRFVRAPSPMTKLAIEELERLAPPVPSSRPSIVDEIPSLATPRSPDELQRLPALIDADPVERAPVKASSRRARLVTIGIASFVSLMLAAVGPVRASHTPVAARAHAPVASAPVATVPAVAPTVQPAAPLALPAPPRAKATTKVVRPAKPTARPLVALL